MHYVDVVVGRMRTHTEAKRDICTSGICTSGLNLRTLMMMSIHRTMLDKNGGTKGWSSVKQDSRSHRVRPGSSHHWFATGATRGLNMLKGTLVSYIY